MASVINTNVQSLNAQRNLSSSQSSLATSLQRLSSGLRINSAKDDAAGLAISDRFTTQIRGLNQAARNANDAISLSQTAEGALGELNNNLQRIRELAVQSANATNSASDRQAIDLEVQQRLAEVERISSQTSFNGQKILDGTFGNAAFQVGANVGETISLDLTTSMRTDSIGAIATATSVDLDTLIATGSTGSAATYAFDTAALVGDYSTVAGTTGTSTIQVTAAAADTDSIVVNGVTFTFSDANTGDTETVVDATNVTIVRDISGTPLTADTTASALSAAIAAYKADANPAYTAFDDVTASVSTDTVTLTYATAGLPSTNGNTIGTASGTLATTNTLDASGTDADTSANATFTITDPESNVITVTLDSNITNATDLLAEITSATGYGAATFTAAIDGTTATQINITDSSNATGSFTIGGTDAATITAQNVAGSTAAGVADVASASVVVSGDFTIQVGTATAVSVADGTYTSAQDLVDAINTALGSSASAELDENNVLTINADEDITIAGAQGLAVMTSATNAVSGDISSVNVLDVSGANDAIRRIDAALGSVSDLRSTFGAVQNRFESTITNLTTAVENLSAARSRIQDADFAAETANLTRAQILQQAGTAMLAQANALPQSVLSLLG